LEECSTEIIVTAVKTSDLRNFSLLLADLPEGDPKLQVEKSRYAVGDTLRGNCSSPASSPPTNLTWIINGKRVCKLNISAVSCASK
jgi:hypothetical protein